MTSDIISTELAGANALACIRKHAYTASAIIAALPLTIVCARHRHANFTRALTGLTPRPRRTANGKRDRNAKVSRVDASTIYRDCIFTK